MSCEDFFSNSRPSPAGEFKNKFIESFENWQNSDGTLDKFNIRGWEKNVISGTTEAFLNFEINYKDRKSYVLKGEYPFHAMSGVEVVNDFTQIKSHSKLIISYPFSATGNRHENLESIIKHCKDNDIKILLDCALLNISEVEPFLIDNDSPILWVCFSLSKSFASGRFRVGVNYSRDNSQSPMRILNEWSYLNHLDMQIHISLMERFSKNYLWDKYRDIQIKLCKEMSVELSSCLLFGLSQDKKYDEFTRSGLVNRLCLSELLEKSFDENS